MGRRQDESEAARKQLIELSREFKKTATEVKKTKSRSTSFFFWVGGGGGWFLAGFLNELSRHRKLGHQYLRTCTLTYLQVFTAVVVFMCLVSVLFCSVLCVWENFVDYQWNESSGQTTFSRPVLWHDGRVSRVKRERERESLVLALGRWVGGRISIHLYFKLPPPPPPLENLLFSAFLLSTGSFSFRSLHNSASIHPSIHSPPLSPPLVMLYHNFLIGFSSLLISWLFKQQTHADNSPGWMSNNNVYNNISYTVVVGGGGRDRQPSSGLSLLRFSFRPAFLASNEWKWFTSPTEIAYLD